MDGTYEVCFKKFMTHMVNDGFFLGARPAFLRTFISSSVCFPGFEIMNRSLTTTEKAIKKWYKMIEYKEKTDDT